MKMKYITPPSWDIEGVTDMSLFLDCLGLVANENSILVLEDANFDRFGGEALRKIAVHPDVELRHGIASPPPEFIFIPYTPANIARMKSVIAETGYVNLCAHLHMFEGTEMKFSWWDTLDLPIAFHPSYPEDTIKEIASMCKATCSFKETF